MAILNVHHRTSYRYSQPVEFGEHRLMSRPRDSHDLRLIDTTLLIDPPPSALRWIHDVFGNSIAIATFDRAADTLTFESAFRAQHYPVVRSEERRVGKECRSQCDWSSDVCSSDLIHDVFGNSIAIATFDRAADTLTFESAFRAQHYPVV